MCAEDPPEHQALCWSIPPAPTILSPQVPWVDKRQAHRDLNSALQGRSEEGEVVTFLSAYYVSGLIKGFEESFMK